MRTTALKVIESATGEIVETIDVSSETETNVERIRSGLLHQMNRAEYHVERVEEK